MNTRIIVLVSGNGTNLQALIDAERAGALGLPPGPSGAIAAVIADNAGAYALQRSRAAGITAYVELPARARGAVQYELSDRILSIARREQADLLILAGFLSILGGDLIDVYAGRMINLHPSLLPKFGGPGMYGEAVHRSVLAAGASESGCTVHLVDRGTDTGPILLQRAVPVLRGDTPETLAERIHREEHIAIVEAAVLMIGRIHGTADETADKTTDNKEHSEHV